MDKKDIKKRVAKIRRIYEKYMGKMEKLKKEQDRVLDEFKYALEEAKKEELRDKLNNGNA